MTTGPRRLGLVVATTEYDDSRLARLGAPLSDALELARTLTDHGGFDVETLINAEAQTVQRRIEKFCKTGRQHTDTLFVYLTGHGVKDADGNLYFALRDTDRDLLRTTALSADLLAAVLDESPARSQVLMLDCCYSGAFARALRPKGDDDAAGLAGTFGSAAGRGRVILAASSAIEPAWEGDSGSIYTRGVVDGIRSGAADLDGDGRITARELHTHVAALLHKEGRQSPRKFEFDDAGELVVARPGNQPLSMQPLVSKRQDPPVAAVTAAAAQATPPPAVPPPTKEPKARRRAPAWIPGMVAVALATLLGTLWLTGAIGFLPSPFAPTTTIVAVETTTTAPATATTGAGTTTTGASTTTAGDTTTTTVGQSTTTIVEVIPVEWELSLDEQFASNSQSWAEGDFSDATGTSSYRFIGGTYEGAYQTSANQQTYWSVIPFTPASELFYVETEVTSYLGGSQCGLALQSQGGFVLAVALGDEQVIARLYSEGTEANTGLWNVAVIDPVETEIGLWVDGTSVTIYVDDVELATFDEPTMAGVSAAGVSLMGGLETYCGFDYLVGYDG
jgi:Caspase domain